MTDEPKDVTSALTTLAKDPHDQKAWVTLYKRMWAYAVAHAYRRLGPLRDLLCEDVAQQSFLRLAQLQEFPTFPSGEPQFRGYFHKVIDRIALDTVKSHLRRTSREALSPHRLATTTDESALQLKILIDRLPPEEGLVLDLAREGYTLQEVATLLDTSVSSAGRHRDALFEKLYQQLAPPPKNPEDE